MSRPTYTYKGFQLYIACPCVYRIARRDETQAIFERPYLGKTGKNREVYMYNTSDWNAYALMSAKNEGERYGKMTARDAFHHWVDKHYGDTYAHKN
ncbi:hypothetical protein [Rothia mucilaginosa]